MPRGHFNHAGRIGMVGGSLPKGQTNLTKLFSILKGGSGSGNFGHKGRKGIRGGSAPISKTISVSEIAESLSGFRIDNDAWFKFRTKALADRIPISQVIRTLLDMWYDGKIIIQEKNKT